MSQTWNDAMVKTDGLVTFFSTNALMFNNLLNLAVSLMVDWVCKQQNML